MLIFRCWSSGCDALNPPNIPWCSYKLPMCLIAIILKIRLASNITCAQLARLPTPKRFWPLLCRFSSRMFVVLFYLYLTITIPSNIMCAFPSTLCSSTDTETRVESLDILASFSSSRGENRKRVECVFELQQPMGSGVVQPAEDHILMELDYPCRCFFKHLKAN